MGDGDEEYLCGKSGETWDSIIYEILDAQLPFHLHRFIITEHVLMGSASQSGIGNGTCLAHGSVSMAMRNRSLSVPLLALGMSSANSRQTPRSISRLSDSRTEMTDWSSCVGREVRVGEYGASGRTLSTLLDLAAAFHFLSGYNFSPLSLHSLMLTRQHGSHSPSEVKSSNVLPIFWHFLHLLHRPLMSVQLSPSW